MEAWCRSVVDQVWAVLDLLEPALDVAGNDPKALYQQVTHSGSALDAFICSSRNEGHTTMTEELGAWIVNVIESAG
ncbi:hypothetical protein ACFRCX_18555 [Streptomyces sp. NPDC056652]|uniref:hypothetical protein n=1 Tax=Streptomyces sp. NPDC056652 TaxID=3345893 RepID=UPI0036A433D8